MQYHNGTRKHQVTPRRLIRRAKSYNDLPPRQHIRQGSNQHDNDHLIESPYKTVQCARGIEDTFKRSPRTKDIACTSSTLYERSLLGQHSIHTHSMDDMSRRKHVYINNTSTNLAPSEYIDVEVGNDPLGIELAANSGKTGVVVKSVAYGPSSKVPDVKNSRRLTIPSGSTINRINDVDVSEWNAERIIETLQVLPHPFVIRFRKNSVAYVLCKLCETKISAEHLNAHTTFCIKSKQHELCIEHINEDLERFANQVLQLMNAPQAISKRCCRYRQYAYSLLLDSTYKVYNVLNSSCYLLFITLQYYCHR